MEIIEERQATLILVENGQGIARTPAQAAALRMRPHPLAPRVTAKDRAAHQIFVSTLGSDAIWNNYQAAASAGIGGEVADDPSKEQSAQA